MNAESPTIGRFISLPCVGGSLGNLTFIEGGRHIPFEVRRVYFLYEVPQGAERGCHAHKKLQQLIIPLAGRFDVILDDGFRRERYNLDQPRTGLYVQPGTWRELNGFAPNSICLVLASTLYDEVDYIRDYDIFIRWARKMP